MIRRRTRLARGQKLSSAVLFVDVVGAFHYLLREFVFASVQQALDRAVKTPCSSGRPSTVSP